MLCMLTSVSFAQSNLKEILKNFNKPAKENVMVVYIVDVLALQLIAIVVDFVLDVEREVGIVVSLMTYEGDIHLRAGSRSYLLF